jgi:hypothetical protein
MWRGFKSQGFAINSSWIFEDGDGQTGDFTELWERITAEIKRSAYLILYAEAGDFPLKGALVEVGIALGFGKPVVIVAPTVKLEGRTFRPLGSWVKHKLVSFSQTVEAALQYVEAQAPPSSEGTAPPQISHDRARQLLWRATEKDEHYLELCQYVEQQRGKTSSPVPREPVDQAIFLLNEISALIRKLEGLPVDFGLARELSSVLHRIEGSV